MSKWKQGLPDFPGFRPKVQWVGLKVENLRLIIEKRAKLVQTRSELERFHISFNDFNCSMRLNDLNGNVFTTSFTPVVKKVIDFLNFFMVVKAIDFHITILDRIFSVKDGFKMVIVITFTFLLTF